MSVDSMTFLINYGDYVYKITVFPLGKGLYNVGCYESKDGKTTKSAYIQDHFSYSMSMNKAKDLLLIFLKHWNS